MKSVEIKLPLFLLCEDIENKITGITYIYSPQHLSLIMVVSENNTTILLNEENRSRPRKTFEYFEKTYEFVIIQNNIEATTGKEANYDLFLMIAWTWFFKYLFDEDRKEIEKEESNLN